MKTSILNHLKQHEGKTLPSLPGFAGWLNWCPESINMETGQVAVSFVVREDMLNPMQMLHGGAMAGMLDEVMGMQLWLLAGEDEAFVAVQLNIDFLRKAKLGDRLLAQPEITRKGRKIVHASCPLVHTETGKIVARATAVLVRM